MVNLRQIKEQASSLLENAVERFEGATAPLQGLIPLMNPNNYSLTADLNWVSPTDCDNNPNSPFCGGRPWSMPLGFDWDVEQDDCYTYLEFDTTIFNAKGPQIQLSYRNPNCIVQPPYPPSITHQLEEEEPDHDDDDDKPEKPPFVYLPSTPSDGSFPNSTKCTNNCGEVFARFLQEVARPAAEKVRRDNSNSRQRLARYQEQIFGSPAAPGKGQAYCDAQRDYYYQRRNRIGDFVSPQYWEEAEPTKKPRFSSNTRYLRLFI
ncbi:MAG: hypothetical protein F6K09_22415, partial [Merismopedia sp. SIO2A8]|nr:hypothetical protein [Merismopedia sp. SIO2A8]